MTELAGFLEHHPSIFKVLVAIATYTKEAELVKEAFDS